MIIISEDMFERLMKMGILDEVVRVDENTALFLVEDEKGEKKKPLNKPMRTPGERKKYKVYTTDPQSGKVVTVRYGDPNMKIKRGSDKHRKNFRSRHGCDKVSFEKDRDTAKYWSCRNWEKNRPAGT